MKPHRLRGSAVQFNENLFHIPPPSRHSFRTRARWRRKRDRFLIVRRSIRLQMGIELILMTYCVALVPLGYGLFVLAAGRVRLSLFSKKVIRGAIARLIGFWCIAIAFVYFVYVVAMWQHYYDR